jgi:hypothetical protein
VSYTDNADLSSFTFVSLLMDNYYPWEFVVGSSVASAQLISYTRTQLEVALGVSDSDILPFALQVYIPDSYKSTSDVQKLGTQVLCYIPADSVEDLAAQLKVKTSMFYNGGSNNDAQSLVSHVMASSSLLSVAAPDDDGSNTGTSSSGAASGSSSTTRQDAIIGVTTALGSVAVLTLLYLVWRTVQRRKEQAHRRMSDPPDMAGMRPEGREFDQDTLGGQRRRSFFYAEDSLRGFQGDRPGEVEDPFMDRVSPSGQPMTQRRHVMPATISTPILRENTMNW